MASNTSTIGSPGIEVREKLSSAQRINTSTACTVFIPGYASQGPVEEVNNIGKIEDFIDIYGEPTNAAERNFYYAVKKVLDKNGTGTTVMTSRLPYGYGKGDNVATAYTMLAYPAVPVVKNPANTKGYDYYDAVEGGDKGTLKQLFTLKKVNSTAENPTVEPVEVSYDIVAPLE